VQAVLLTLKRKQQDASGALVEIAKAMGDDELKQAAVEMGRSMKSSADELAGSLSKLAVSIARQGGGVEMAASSR
jgi:hypothetical protein